MKKYFNYENLLTRKWRRSLFVGFILLTLALVFQIYASSYSTRVSSSFVHDIILDNVPVINLSAVIVEGALLVIAGTIFLVLSKPRYILFTLKAIAVFIATRALFIALTHLGIYPGGINPDNGFFDRIYTDFGLQGGYFFSGHTGLPILLGLIFWNKKLVRYIYFLIAFVFGTSVLLAHVHYSIDVFAAPYIAYCIFKLCQYLFAEDYELIVEDKNQMI